MAVITPQGHGLGWKQSLPNPFKPTFKVRDEVMAALPSSVDLRPGMPAVYDQQQIGSCVANATAGAIQFDRMKLKDNPDFIPSRLFMYFIVRAMEGDVPVDGGATVGDMITCINNHGAPPEWFWPYVPTPADPNTNLFPPGSPPVEKPSQWIFTKARKYKPTASASVPQSLAQMKGVIASGFPFVFGWTVYDSIYDANGNPVTVLPMPSSSDQVLGGHATVACGYDDSTQLFTIRNSWGELVQDHGYFYMPYAYATDPNLSSDFWVISRMTD